jgi:hypothetical protein
MKRLCPLLLLFLSIALPTWGEQTAKVVPSVQLDLQTYLSELGRWSASAGRLREHPEEAAALHENLPAQWSVSVQEQQFQVPTQWLGDALDKLAKNPKAAHDVSAEISGRLKSMLQDAQALAQNNFVDPASARARLDKILKRREFRSIRTTDETESLWDQFTDWVWKIFTRILNGAAGHPNVTKVLLWALVTLLGLSFLVWLIYSLSRVSLADLTSRRVRNSIEDANPAKSWREMAQVARAAAANGNFREPIRIIYAAAVLRISEAGVWRLDSARTHREYLHLLPQDSLQRPPLAAITTCFERVWYGHGAATAMDFEAVLAELESLP